MKFSFKSASVLAVCAAALLSASCVQEMKDQHMPEFITGISVVGEDVDFSEFQTKVSYTDRLAFSWNVGDKLGIFPIGGKQQEFPLSDIDNGSTANFDGGAWALRSNYEYAGYYPYTTAKSDTEDMMLPVDYTHQKQVGNRSTANLGEYSYMVSEATRPTASGSVNLQMKQVGGVVRAEACVPADVEFVRATIVDESAEMIVGGKVDLGRKHSGSSAFVPEIEEAVYGSSVTVELEDVVIEESADGSNNLIFYFWMAPQSLAGHELSIVLEDVNGYEYTQTVDCSIDVLAAKGKRIDFGVVEEPADVDYLCFTAVDGAVEVSFVIENAGEWDAPSIQYSLDKRHWSDMNQTVSLENGESMFFRGNNETFSGDYNSGNYVYFSFAGSGMVSASGNIMTMLDRRGLRDSVPEYCFNALFCRCAKLLSAPELPATTLASSCYFMMFAGCTSLTSAPALPATHLVPHCYNCMFADCTSLTTAPELPATELADHCYKYMFAGCTGLTTAPELPATELASGCYAYMFEGCTGLVAAPALPATTLASSCYFMMFAGCTSLTSAPALPATHLVPHCYNCMFADCTSLTTAPELPATELADHCYKYMFAGCTGLVAAPALPATELARACYASMFDGCSSLTSAPALPAENLAEYCYNNMFARCTNLVDAPALPAMSLAEWCYNGMFNSCRSLTAAPALPATELAASCYGSMFTSCRSLTVAPELPATVLVEDCYGNMFRGCYNLNRVSAAFLAVPDDIDPFNVNYKWLGDVAPTGTFYKNPEATWTREEAHIPAGWAIITGTGASGEDLDPEW